jgi:hypothetical protein
LAVAVAVPAVFAAVSV